MKTASTQNVDEVAVSKPNKPIGEERSYVLTLMLSVMYPLYLYLVAYLTSYHVKAIKAL